MSALGWSSSPTHTATPTKGCLTGGVGKLTRTIRSYGHQRSLGEPSSGRRDFALDPHIAAIGTATMARTTPKNPKNRPREHRVGRQLTAFEHAGVWPEL
jgi:hypothetical protein